MHLLNFCLGFINSMGFYTLFYKNYRPPVRWRAIALCLIVVLYSPFSMLYESIFVRSDQRPIVLIIIGVLAQVIPLLTCAFLGVNRMQALVTAAFGFCVVTISEIPPVYLFLAILQSLLGTPDFDLYEVIQEFQPLYICGLFINHLIILGCCYVAGRCLGASKGKPKFFVSVCFCLFFVFFAFVLLVWWLDIMKVMPLNYLASAFFSLFLVGMLLITFYLFTRLSFSEKPISVNETSNTADTTVGNYIRYIGLLSRREIEVIEAILQGNISYKEISASLNISTNTVKTHLKNIYKTTGISGINALKLLFHGYSANHLTITQKSP